MNKTILIIIVVLLVVVGGYFLLRGGYQALAPAAPIEEVVTPKGEAVASPVIKEITVSGNEYSFNPFSITVSAGERVKITFKNDGRAPHDLIIEGLGIGTETIGGGETETIEFTAPVSGTYIIFCSVPGHRSSGMEGQLIVE